MNLASALGEQRAFIQLDPHRSALLAAGPGTGKTWVLERRSEFLSESGAQSSSIAVLTLTRSLARELSERMPHGSASTVHSFILRQLNLLGDAWGRFVVTPWEQKELVRRDLALGYELSFGHKIGLGEVEKFLRKLGSSFRERQDLPADLTPTQEQLRQVFLQQRELFLYRLMDEMAYDLVRIVEAGTPLADPPAHLLVDEYQDLTAGELRLLQLLHERAGAVLNAVGDDRQSIYGFREADPRALHNFPGVYGIAEPNYLWRSNRCPAIVCDLANRIASGLPPLPGLERPNLQPWPGREDPGALTITSYPSPVAEARAVVEGCNELLASGVRPHDVIVVVAGYYDPVFATLVKAAAEAGRGGLFIDPRGRADITLEARLAGTGARLLANANDQLAWRTLAWATPGLAEGRLSGILQAQGASYVQRLRALSESDARVAAVLTAGRSVIDRLGAADEVDLREVAAIIADALELQLDPVSVDALGDTMVKPRDAVRFLFELDEAAAEEEAAVAADAVAVHTIHSAKGLQAPHVFLVNAVNQSFAGRGDAADGLRRAYVAVTRASSALHISAPTYVRYTALGNQMGVNTTVPADFLVDHCRQAGVDLTAVASR